MIERMQAGADQWEIVELKALAGEDDVLGRAPGEALWPEEYSVPKLERRRENTLPRYFSAMYQQQPVPDEGELFAANKIGLRTHTSDIFNRVRAWDLAGSVEGDWTCGVLIGRTRNGHFVVINVRRLRGTPDKVQQAIVERRQADAGRALRRAGQHQQRLDD